MPGDGQAFAQHVMNSILSGGFAGFPQGPANNIFGMPAPGASEQEWLDQVMSQLMTSYEPATQPTAARIRNGLPRLKVRAAASTGEAREGEACTRAGEPCAVCQDLLEQGTEVLELPCSHVGH